VTDLSPRARADVLEFFAHSGDIVHSADYNAGLSIMEYLG
jgi:hypothetical protein